MYIKKQTKFFWFIFLLTLPHLNPDYLNKFNILGTFIDVMRLVSFGVIIVLYIIMRKRISWITLSIAALQGYIFIITYIYRGPILQYSKKVFSVISVVLLYEVFLAYDKAIFLKTQLLCFEIVIYINLITEVIYPSGLYKSGTELSSFVSEKNWFIGFYNTHTQIFIPALMIAFLYADYTGRKLRTLLLYIAVWISALLVRSGGVLLSLLIMTIIYIFFKNYTRIFNFYSYWLLQCVFFVFIICLKAQTLFYWLIEGILHKWSSLTDRMSLWDKTKEFIMEHPVFGHGYQIALFRQTEVGLQWGSHAHNMLLEILYKGGLVYLFLYIICIIICGQKINEYRETMPGKIISCSFLGWCVHSLVEPYETSFLMAMFVVGYLWDDVDEPKINHDI